MSMHHQRGFTLVELMIVVAILGLLSSIAIASFKAFRYKAYDAITVENARILFLYQNSFYDEYRQFVPVDSNEVSGNGVISKNVIIPSGTVTFELKGLNPDVAIAAVTDANNQTVTVGGKHPSNPVILAIDYDASSKGFRKKDYAGTFSEASLPVATSNDDLAGWADYP